MEIKWTSASRKHRIGRESIRHVVGHPVYVGVLEAPVDSSRREPRHLFVGPDHRGVELEVIGVKTSAGLLIIHAMKLRDKTRKHLEGGTE